jgi:hypothetical protein
LRDYLQTPFPDPRTEVGDLQLLAVDLETTGLHPKNDRLLSIGFVPIDGFVDRPVRSPAVRRAGRGSRSVRARRSTG